MKRIGGKKAINVADITIQGSCYERKNCRCVNGVEAEGAFGLISHHIQKR